MRPLQAGRSGDGEDLREVRRRRRCRQGRCRRQPGPLAGLPDHEHPHHRLLQAGRSAQGRRRVPAHGAAGEEVRPRRARPRPKARRLLPRRPVPAGIAATPREHPGASCCPSRVEAARVKVGAACRHAVWNQAAVRSVTWRSLAGGSEPDPIALRASRGIRRAQRRLQDLFGQPQLERRAGDSGEDGFASSVHQGVAIGRAQDLIKVAGHLSTNDTEVRSCVVGHAPETSGRRPSRQVRICRPLAALVTREPATPLPGSTRASARADGCPTRSTARRPTSSASTLLLPLRQRRHPGRARSIAVRNEDEPCR